VYVYPALGEPYLGLRQYVRWPAAAAEHRLDLAAPRGVQVRGTVMEAGADRPVPGAAVTYKWAYQNNPHREWADPELEWRFRGTRTDAGGKFAITLPPGPGQLMVKAAEPDYIRAETSSQQVEGGLGGEPYFPDAFFPLNLQRGDSLLDLPVQLRRGVVLHGRVESSDGNPVKSALLFTPQYLPDGIEFKGRHLVVRDGRFELPGCEPGGKVGVWVYDPQNKEGGHSEFVVGETKDPVLRLAPCVSGTVRVADRAGKAVAEARLSFDLVLRPGEDANQSAHSGKPAGLGVPATAMYSLARRPTDAGDGTFHLPDLIPGATYAVWAMAAGRLSEKETFTAPATGVHDLGTLTVKPPVPRNNPRPPAVGRAYIYEMRALDPDGDPITFDLVEGPPGMSFDPETGVLFWLPGPTQVGRHSVVLRASDPYGGTAVQKWQITVFGPPPGPDKP
jgi:hypothetical protein